MDHRKRLPTPAKANSSQRDFEEADRIYANLSAAKQNALLTCLKSNGLQKRAVPSATALG
jgi:hypothetical protein